MISTLAALNTVANYKASTEAGKGASESQRKDSIAVISRNEYFVKLFTNVFN